MSKIISRLIIFGLLGIGLGSDSDQEGDRIEQDQPIDDVSETDSLSLKDSPFCATEIKKLCSHKAAKDDYLIIGCLDQAASNGKLVNEQCQHYIWKWKKSQTVSPAQQELAMRKCGRDMVEVKAKDCVQYYDQTKGEDNKIIPCLLDYRLDIDPKEHGECQRFLTDVSLVVFSDYRLICNFVSNCKSEIEQFECGRVSSANVQEWLVPHSQGEVVACLEEKLADQKIRDLIGEPCQREIVNLAELTADDFQLDRHFYLACRDDRDTFCGDIAAGEGRIYQCLFKNKFNREMSRDCAAAIEVREKLIYETDYDAGFHLHKKCRKTFKQFGCDKDMADNLQMGREFAGLSRQLICVEHKLKHIHKKENSPKEIDPDCDKELELYRQFLMSDYELSPKVVAHCQTEIIQHCQGMRKQGETLHCLMGLETETNIEISEDCDEALYELVEETEADTDFRVDAKLQASCNPVVKTLCGDSMLDDADILQCLLENLHNQVLVTQHPECRKNLLEVQYFLARDFSYDKHFRKACAEEADELCGAPDMGAAQDEEDLVIPLSLIVKCLYSHTHPFPDDNNSAAGRRLSNQCTNQVHRIMKERSMEVGLNDELDKACKPAMGEHCSEMDIEKGIEFLCLQDKFDEIKANPEHAECAEQIEILTGIASQELDLEQVLFQACEPMVQKFCSQVIQQEDEGQVLGCLINHKNDPDMNDKCSAGVFHFQIISLDSYKLSYAFYKACKSDIKKICKIDGNQKKSKQEIIQCLSEEKRNSILSDRNTQMSSECQDQVTFELLGEFEDLRLNPNLERNCLDDVKKYCNNIKKGDGALMECLRGQEHNLSGSCHRVLFKEMELQAQIPAVDYFLMRVCKNEIKHICAGKGNIQSAVDCLADHIKKNKESDDVSNPCKKAVRARQIVQDKDIRLNPRLERNCQQDIPNLCMNVLREKTSDGDLEHASKEELMEGKIIGCLKEQFVILQQSPEGDHDPSQYLSKKCATHIEKIMTEEAQDFELDPELMKSCGGTSLSPLSEDGMCSRKKHTDPIECLKQHFMDENLKGEHLTECRKYVALLIKESQVDVAVDATLQNACGIDIKTHCSDIDPGHGRRITCLVNQMKHKPDTLQEECLGKLMERQGMWNKARQIDGIGALAVAVTESNHAKYIVGVLAGISAGIMFCGIYLGRITSSARQRKAL